MAAGWYGEKPTLQSKKCNIALNLTSFSQIAILSHLSMRASRDPIVPILFPSWKADRFPLRYWPSVNAGM
jgi:hypothetical protein